MSNQNNMNWPQLRNGQVIFSEGYLPLISTNTINGVSVRAVTVQTENGALEVYWVNVAPVHTNICSVVGSALN